MMTASARILIVDDRHENLVALEALLRPLGQDVVCVASGEQALAALLMDEFAVVLLDVRMPGMDGFETAAHIKRRERTRLVPIIFMTAVNDNIESALRAYSHGAVDYLTKPFNPDILRSKVAVFVDLFTKTHLLEEQTRLLAESNRELQEMAQAAEAASEAKSAFLNMIGHELRTPLTVIGGYASLLREGSCGDVPAGMERPLHIVEAKSDELGRLVESLLAAAQLERGALTGRAEPIDIGAAVSNAVRRLQPRATLHGAEMVVHVPDDPVVLRFDTQHLDRVLDNLLNNAISYGGKSPWVSVTVSVADDAAHIRVEDRGTGIPEHLHERIFERFVRGSEAGVGPPGSGLGLWLCRELLKPWDASLELESSAPGAGSCFVVRIPLGVATTSGVPASSGESVAASDGEPGVATNGKHVGKHAGKRPRSTAVRA